MLTTMRRRPVNLKLALSLVAGGVVVGYLSFENLDFWGGTSSRYQALWICGFFAGVLAFVSGLLALLEIIFRLVTSGATPAQLPTQAGTVDRNSDIRLAVAGTRGGMQSDVSRTSAGAFHAFRISLVALMLLACASVWHWGGPGFNSAYGRSYWLGVLVTFLLNQLPYGISLVRTWDGPERIGLGLAGVASVGQLLALFISSLRYPATPPDPWPWINGLVCMAVISLAGVAWSALSRRADVGLLASILFGFAAYTTVAQVFVAVLESRVRG